MSRNLRQTFLASTRLRVIITLASVACMTAALIAWNKIGSAQTGPSPMNGMLNRTKIGSANAVNYADPVGSSTNDTFFAGQGTCAVPSSCSTFTLTIDSTVGTAAGTYDPTKYSIFIEIVWPHAAEDYDTWVCSGAGNCVQANVVASNTSTTDPETITLPTSTAPGDYTINAVMATGAFEPYTGTVYLAPIPQTTSCTGNCTPPRYQNYGAGPNQANNAGEPSIGVDWNPNVATLKDTTSKTLTTGNTRLNTGGVAFFTSGANEWRASFNDCASPAYNSRVLSISATDSPAVNNWEDVSAQFTQQFVLSDPIGFVDHYSSSQLGLGPAPQTPGRVFTLDLIGGQGDSLGSFSDDDGNSYLPGGNGGVVQGPDHETLGGGPYNPNSTPAPPPQTVAYGSPNAIYYCSQNIVAEAQCSRSDNGGQTFGPAVPIFNPSQCTGGIHGHIKVAPDGTVYVPNSSCGTAAGVSGVAVSTDNGLTWTENNVTGSVNGSQDPSVGVGQNNVGKPGTSTTNTIYLGYIDGGHAHIADSHDRGLTWEHNTDVGVPFGITHAVFPVVVAGDDNRAAFGFLGTGNGISTDANPCDPYGATLNCKNIWHLYIATTYDGGANWITVDATPDDPVQQGTICLQGTLCSGGRNLLDFNDFTVDAEGRGLVGYADGCPNCGNAFTGQSGASHGTIARQSGGRRLFHAFDPTEPMPPAAPQLISAVSQSPGALITWLEPDNGGSPITGYNIYRGTASGAELPLPLASVSGGTTTKYFDPSPPSGDVFYYVKAINAIGEGEHCGEVSLGTGPPPATACILPGLPILADATGDELDMLPSHDIQSLHIAEPYLGSPTDQIVFTLKMASLSTVPPNTNWPVQFNVGATTYTARMSTVAPATALTPVFEYYQGALNALAPTTTPADPASTFFPDGTIRIVVPRSGVGNPAIGSNLTMFLVRIQVFAGAVSLTPDNMPDSLTPSGTYTIVGNQSCRPNTPPVAVLTATPTSGTSPLVVHLDGSGSYDPDTAPPPDTIASYTFDFGDGSPAVTQSAPNSTVDHTYTCPTSACDYPARLTVTDSRGAQSTNQAQVIIHVTGNTACKSPTANPDSASTTVNHSVVINVVANDNNGGSPPLTVTSVTQPTHGTATNNGNGTVTYTPNHNFVGTDGFTYTIKNKCGAKATGSVTVTVSQSTTLPCNGTTVEDDDPHIAYSNGWHSISNPSASAGHYALNEGGNNQHNAVLSFDDTAPTGSVTYFYATSPKGGSAEIFLDNADMGAVSYNGPTGSNRSPAFGASKSFSYGPTMGGHHTLEIRPIHDGIYIDGFCLPASAMPTGTPSAHPGNTSESLATQSGGQSLQSSITLPAGTQAISIAAEPSVAAPIQLVLINPSGTVLQTVNSSSGVAILEAPITQSGVYIIKTVNLGLGPVQVWSVATPLVSTPLVSQMQNGPATERREGTPQGGPLSPLWSNILLEVYERVLTSSV